ncbi:MAG: uroporphyrinogen decarboxylase [Rhodospirillales bacterium]|nr:uroporphyrinogen decarboxylase [Rhodospirillales bacterium]
MERKLRKPFLEALRGKTQAVPPVWLMRQAGRYLPEYRATRAKAGGFLDLCYTPELAIEVTLQPLRRYQFDAAILFSDILVLPDALGRKVAFVEGEGPILEPLVGQADIQRMTGEGFHERLAPVYATLKGLAKAIPAQTALIGFAGAPWTVATYLIEGKGGTDFANAKAWIYGRSADFEALIDKLTDFTVEYLLAQIEAGAEAVQIFDSWASALSEMPFRRYCIRPMQTIVERLRARHAEIPIIGFPRACGALALDYVAETGVDAISLDPGVPAAWAASHLQPKACVQGNLDPMLLVAGGKPMEREIDRLVAELGQGPYVFNLGHGIVPQTPPEHVARLVEHLRAR